jgi:hypothetical protein
MLRISVVAVAALLMFGCSSREEARPSAVVAAASPDTHAVAPVAQEASATPASTAGANPLDVFKPGARMEASALGPLIENTFPSAVFQSVELIEIPTRGKTFEVSIRKLAGQPSEVYEIVAVAERPSVH